MPGIFLERKLFSRWQDWAGDSRQRILRGAKKEDGVFWSCSLVRLMGQVSADQRFLEWLLFAWKLQATAIVCPAVGSRELQAAWLPG